MSPQVIKLKMINIWQKIIYVIAFVYTVSNHKIVDWTQGFNKVVLGISLKTKCAVLDFASGNVYSTDGNNFKTYAVKHTYYILATKELKYVPWLLFS